MKLTARVTSVIAALCALSSGTAVAGFKEDIGHARLASELGSATPDGDGIAVSHIEFNRPDPDWPDFYGKTFVYPTVVTTVESGQPTHTTQTAALLAGNSTSIAPGVSTILHYPALQWRADPETIGESWLLNVPSSVTSISGGILPGFDISRVGTHSYLYGESSTSLRRLDWYIATDETIHFVGMNNGAGSYSLGLPLSYNTVSVGRSDGLNGTGATTSLDGFRDSGESYYDPGRPRPIVVAPAAYTSSTTPIAASVAVLLVQTGHDSSALSTDRAVVSTVNRAGILVRNAERVEVVKAALMAGADRTTRFTSGTSPQYLNSYRATTPNQTANGLDARLGAGQVNVYNSYHIIAAGEKNSYEDGGTGSEGVSERGFDYDPAFGGANDSNEYAHYILPPKTSAQVFTASLVWNIAIQGGTEEDPDVFDGSTVLHNLNLALVDTTTSGSPVVVATSNSSTENTENIWFELQANHSYSLRVSRSSGGGDFEWDYGVAWQITPDADADGAPDDHDNCVNHANGPFIPDTGGNVQYDTDNDGYGNRCDADLNNNGYTNAADTTLYNQHIGNTGVDDADFNGNGFVNAQDTTIRSSLIGLPPGPSAYAP